MAHSLNEFELTNKLLIMEQLKIDDFLDYCYLSGLNVSEDGVFFTVSKAKKDKSGYYSDFYTLRGKEVRQLTSDGKASYFTTYKGSLYFLAKRSDEEKKEENSLKSTIYCLPLDGGEALPFLTVDEAITRFDVIDKSTLVALYYVDKRLESLSGEERAKRAKQIKDYEEIEESSFYLNGGGFINGRRQRLAIIRDKEITKVFNDDFSVDSYTLSPDKTKLIVLGETRVSAKMQFTTEVRVVSIKDGSWYIALPLGQLSVSGAWFVGESIIALASDLKEHGINQNPDFYTIVDGRAKLLTKWGEAIYSSVGSDVRLKGGSSATVDGSWLYFTTTLGHSSFIYRINARGKIEAVVQEEGSIDCLSSHKGKLYFIGLRKQKLQELYSALNGVLTHFNDKVLKGKYVAKPEEIRYENDGVKLVGWVIKPYNYDKNKKYPAILDIHGGPKTVYGTVFMHEMQYWANMGYFVFWTNPRGSDGHGDCFADIRGKYGTIDYSDLMAFTDAVLEKYPSINPRKIGETGGSYGGFMSNWILGHTNRFAAIATQRSIYNWISFFGTSDIGPYFAQDQCNASFRDLESMYHRSPMERIITNASTPTLIIHSDKDYRCPVEQAYQLYNTLVELGVDSRFVLFHDETHELSRSGKPSNRLKRLEEITAWFEKYLK